MTHQQTDFPVPGFVAHEFDFGALFARLSPQTQNLIFDEVVTPAVKAEMDPATGMFYAVTIVAHSDRVDVPGATPENRRAEELKFSKLRAESAADWLFNEVFLQLQASGATAPIDWVSAQNIVHFQAAAGAADLIHTVPSGEAERQVNRRVQFLVTTFTP